MKNKILLGSHVGLKAPNYFLDSAKEAVSYGETAFMIYTGAPQNTKRVPLSELKISEAKEILSENDISLLNVVIHAPYIINLANNENSEKLSFSIDILKNEIKRTAALGAKYLVIHPGNALNLQKNDALDVLINSLRQACDEKQDVTICIETMAGKGSEICSTFEEIHYVLSHLIDINVGVCLDTCHIHDAGYDVDKFDEVLKEFDNIIGLKYLKVIHLNNSKNPRGSHKDRHANIDDGFISFESLQKIVFNERLASIPKILETPYINGLPPYKDEIKKILDNKS